MLQTMILSFLIIIKTIQIFRSIKCPFYVSISMHKIPDRVCDIQWLVMFHIEICLSVRMEVNNVPITFQKKENENAKILVNYSKLSKAEIAKYQVEIRTKKLKQLVLTIRVIKIFYISKGNDCSREGERETEELREINTIIIIIIPVVIVVLLSCPSMQLQRGLLQFRVTMTSNSRRNL